MASLRGWLQKVVGDVAHDAADDGYPIKVGGKASTSEPSAVSNGDRVNAYFDANGRLHVVLDSITAGDINIGNVDVASIAAGDNNIGNVDIASALPTGTNAIGKLAANSGVDIGDVDVLSVVHPTALATISHGERAGSATAVQLATVTAKFVRIKAVVSNAGNVYVGSSNAVTVVAGTTTTTAGFELAPGDDTGWLPASNLNLFWIICNNAGDDISYMVIA